jgi:DNA-binding Lrp family transcriptional regulator
MAAEQMAEEGPEGRVPPPRPLDVTDRAILRILRTDGRASIRSVADRVHVSRANAYARINRLIDDGVIRGFSARVDQDLLHGSVRCRKGPYPAARPAPGPAPAGLPGSGGAQAVRRPEKAIRTTASATSSPSE